MLRKAKWGREVIPVTRSVAGTVRRFISVGVAEEYIVRQRVLEEAVEKAKPKSFVLQKVQILSKNGPNLLERVYLAPTLYDFLGEDQSSRYFPAFQRRLERKGFNWAKIENQLNEDARRADSELIEITNNIH